MKKRSMDTDDSQACVNGPVHSWGQSYYRTDGSLIALFYLCTTAGYSRTSSSDHVLQAILLNYPGIAC